jgi:hypothetical protein
MRHVFGIRNGNSAMLLRGHNGRAIRQHLTGHHRYGGGALTANSIVSNVMEAPKKLVNVVKKAGRTYVPLKFRI